MLNFVPLESLCSAESSESTKESKSDFVPRESGRKIGINEQGVLSDQIAVIVVNTKTVDKEMIISRRSTYQKVLAMEKEGVQVVERDSDLPVDLMLSPAICLVWYDCGSVSKKSDATIGASSSSLSWIGDIATNVLTSLSFGFSTCVMVNIIELCFVPLMCLPWFLLNWRMSPQHILKIIVIFSPCRFLRGNPLAWLQ